MKSFIFDRQPQVMYVTNNDVIAVTIVTDNVDIFSKPVSDHAFAS